MSGELLLMSAVAWCAVLPMLAVVLCAPHQVSWGATLLSADAWCSAAPLLLATDVYSERMLMSVDMFWAAADVS